jgi:hypothetical protein
MVVELTEARVECPEPSQKAAPARARTAEAAAMPSRCVFDRRSRIP